MKFLEICRCRNEEKNIKKYKNTAHNSEFKLYLRDWLCEVFIRRTNTKEISEKKKKYHKTSSTQNKFVFAFYGFAHWVAYYRRFLLLISWESKRLHVAFDAWWISGYSKRSLKGLLRGNKNYGWSLIRWPLYSECFMHATLQFFLMSDGRANQREELELKFDKKLQKMIWRWKGTCKRQLMMHF